MRIEKLETFLTHAGLKNYLFVRLTTDTGVTGLGEATLEWQERAVQALLHEWVQERILGADPRDHEQIIERLIRDQYQGGPTILTAISGVEVALWDIAGKEAGQPVYELLGGPCRERLPAYANAWYGGLQTPGEYARRAREVVGRGFGALKFDPLGRAWKGMSPAEMDRARDLVGAVRDAVGGSVQIMIEVHGRLSQDCAIEMGLRLSSFHPAWYEEPVAPHSLDSLVAVRKALPFPIAAGERLYTLEELRTLVGMGAVDVIQMDPAHCGGLRVALQAARAAEQEGMTVSPHCSIGPVALCAALHFDWAAPNVAVQEDFSTFDVPWRSDLVAGWNPLKDGTFVLPDRPGLGIELDLQACAAHPYQPCGHASLWDEAWLEEFTQSSPPVPSGNPENSLD